MEENKIDENKKANLIPLAIVVAGIAIAGAIMYIGQQKKPESGVILSPQEVGEKAIKFINENLTQKDTTASLINVTEESGLYKFRLKIREKEFTSYATKDGKILFPEEGINLEKQNSRKETAKTCEEITKTDKPLLEAFIVSQCPFGLQMQRILNDIVKNIPDLISNIKVEYIGSIEENKIVSMHGEEEAKENLRQICIREEQGDKYWKYIDCYIKKGETENCLKNGGIDKGKLNGCLSDNSRGLKYIKEDFANQEKYKDKISGSPSLFLNSEKVSEFDFGGRTAQAVKNLLCCGFKTIPEFCSQKLTEEQAIIGFSEQGAGSASGSCK